MTTKSPRANWRTPDATKSDVDENTDRATWLRERRNGIGGTDATALMGTNVGKVTPRDVFNEKISTAEPRELNLAHFRFGHLLEPRLMAEAAAHHGVKVRKGAFYRNKNEPWRYANPDALTSDNGLLECKTTGEKTKAAQAWRAGEVSPHAYDQTQHYLAVTGRAHARYVVGINPAGWRDLPEYEWVDAVTEVIHVGPIERDEERIAEILEAERDFWACVQAGALTTRWAPREVEAPIPEMVDDDLARLSVVKAEQAALSDERAVIEARLKAALGGEAGFLTVNGAPRVQLTAYDVETFDKKRFVAEHPDLAANYLGKRCQKRLTIVNEGVDK